MASWRTTSSEGDAPASRARAREPALGSRGLGAGRPHAAPICGLGVPGRRALQWGHVHPVPLCVILPGLKNLEGTKCLFVEVIGGD